MNDFLSAIENLPLDAMTKGLPLADGSLRLGDVGRRGWNVLRGDMPVPLLTLREARMKNNMRVMERYAAHHGALLAPHGKTTMCPQLYRAMIDEGGAWGITAATVQQAAVAAASGVTRIVIANEVVGRANIQQLAGLKRAHPEAEFFSLVDSLDAVAQLVRFGQSHMDGGQRFQVLAEVGHHGGRTGARTLEQATAVIEAVTAETEILELAGVEGYEGTISRDDPGQTVEAVDDFLDFAVAVFQRARSMGALDGRAEVLLSAGGSAYFDRVVAKFCPAAADGAGQVVLRGGCYLTYDHGAYRRKLEEIDARGGLEGGDGHIAASVDFTPALELWAMVESLQDPGVAIMTMGRRDLPYDAGYPVLLRQYRDGALCGEIALDDPSFEVTQSNDQHSYLSYPEGHDLRVGDLLAFGISHPCTAFDKWDVLYTIDEACNVTGALKTFF